MGVFRSVYSDVMISTISNNSPFSCALALCFFLPMMCATPAAAEDLFERLRETRLTNLEDVIEAASTDSPGSGAFLVRNPYSSSDQPDATPRDGTPSSAYALCVLPMMTRWLTRLDLSLPSKRWRPAARS